MPLTVFFDVDTQFDFVLPAGAMHVPGSERLLPTIARLNEFAAAQGILVLSTVDAHPENDSEFTEYAAHCIRETAGQRKPDSTLLTPRATLPEGTAFLPPLDGVKQVLVEGPAWFANATDGCHHAGCDELRSIRRGRRSGRPACNHGAVYGVRVQLVTDAVGQVNESIARRARNEFVRDGGLLIESTALVSAPPDVPYGTTVR
jgi:hypothetical protein